MDGLFTKMQIAGADSKSIFRELMALMKKDRWCREKKKIVQFNQNRPKRIDHISTYMNLRILVSL